MNHVFNICTTKKTNKERARECELLTIRPIVLVFDRLSSQRYTLRALSHIWLTVEENICTFSVRHTLHLPTLFAKFEILQHTVNYRWPFQYTIHNSYATFVQNLTFDFEKYNFLSLSQWWGLQFGCCFCFILLFSSLILYQLRGYH